MASDYGFCQGVRRAVERSLEAAAALAEEMRSPARATGPETPRLFVTGELIHNPSINQRLAEVGVVRLPAPGTPGRLDAVRPQDRVIIPAFGIELHEERQLRSIGCEVIDTTCGWVRKVWRAVAQYGAAGLTVVVHGRAEHEETRATVSRCRGPHIVVRDLAAAHRLAARVRVGAPTGGADLTRLGLVNQTTMLRSETAAIAEALRQAMRERLGAAPGPDRFRTLDTFCPATQERQDAVRELLATASIDVMIVVGGFRSSNTAHLARLAAEQVPTYHVEDAACLRGPDEIRHLPPNAPAPLLERGWLPPPPATIGVTAGASTPDDETRQIVERLMTLAELRRSHTCGSPTARRRPASDAAATTAPQRPATGGWA